MGRWDIPHCLDALGCIVCRSCIFAAVVARADTIVLKNGRRIVANSVRDEGDKVKYETSAGELSLPKSIVDHIEKGGGVPMGDSPAAAAANLAITPPAMVTIKRRHGNRERRRA